MSSYTNRFTDLNEEVVTQIPTPIFGYENEPVSSLEKALEPVQHAFEGLQEYVRTAKVNSAEEKEGLTVDESAAIRLYTMDFFVGRSVYKVLNETLRSEKRRDLKIWFKYLKLFMNGVGKLPSRSGIVWRGIRDVDLSDQYQNGTKRAWWGISSCTATLNVLESNEFLGRTGNRTIFSIECFNGKSIKQHSRYSSEEEIILMPGFYFEVMSQASPSEGLKIIHLKEIVLPPIPNNSLSLSGKKIFVTQSRLTNKRIVIF